MEVPIYSPLTDLHTHCQATAGKSIAATYLLLSLARPHGLTLVFSKLVFGEIIKTTFCH